WRCSGPLPAGGSEVPTSTMVIPPTDAIAPTSTVVLSSTTLGALPPVTTIEVADDPIATSTTIGTTTTIVVADVVPSTWPVPLPPGDVEYYFERCELVGKPGEPSVVAGPGTVEWSATTIELQPASPSTCITTGEAVVLSPTCWKMAVDNGTGDAYLDSLKSYV